MKTSLAMTAPPIGLLAGWGDYPLVVAAALRRQGHRVAALGIRKHADPALMELCDEFAWIGLGSLGRAIRQFRRWGVRRATMAGKVHKAQLFQPGWWLTHRPDWTCLRTFSRQLLYGASDRKDDTLLNLVVEAFAKGGIVFEPATDFAPELLVGAGQIAGRPLSARQRRDVEFGWELAKRMGDLDIGQTVCVMDQAPLAVEAIEGTDACIRRAGELCGGRGFTVVKVAKPRQDMRFDVPTVGVKTLQSIAAAGGHVLAVEADRTILLDAADFHRIADELRISVLAVPGSQTVTLLNRTKAA
ncbi:MAG: UDP-2,3-diacylglucosamine diphosphatase LpxI [Pirellulales bacterium]|nr:UDP-2,3-diacylglucosamine diphosphatase LpxI [Pirellulales bacterium]